MCGQRPWPKRASARHAVVRFSFMSALARGSARPCSSTVSPTSERTDTPSRSRAARLVPPALATAETVLRSAGIARVGTCAGQPCESIGISRRGCGGSLPRGAQAIGHRAAEWSTPRRPSSPHTSRSWSMRWTHRWSCWAAAWAPRLAVTGPAFAPRCRGLHGADTRGACACGARALGPRRHDRRGLECRRGFDGSVTSIRGCAGTGRRCRNQRAREIS